MPSPWLQIPLSDYEAHMASSNVDQAVLIADALSCVLQEFRPSSIAVIGCAGGNGFDRIDPRTVPRVIGVDINPEYLEATARRYSGRFTSLVLCNADIAGKEMPRVEPVELTFAALVFEYVDVPAAVRNLRSVCREAGYLVTLVQLPSAAMAVITPTPFPSVLRLGAAMTLVDPSVLEGMAQGAGFAHRKSATLVSSAGKQFELQVYQRSAANAGAITA